ELNKVEGFHSGSEIRYVGIEGMGCTSSKKVLRTKSFKPNLHRPFPRVAAIPIIEDFLLANGNEQFVALICRNDSITKQVPAATKQETLPSSISKDNEGKGVISGNPKMLWSDLQSGGPLSEEESEKHTPAEEEESEKYKAAEEGSEKDRATEEDKAEIIYTCELMDGLEDGEADHTSEKPTDNGDGTRLIRTAGRSKSMGYFHTLEEYDVLAKSKTSHTSEKPTENSDEAGLIRTAGRSKSMEYIHTVEEYDAVLARSETSPTLEENDVVLARIKTSLWDRNSKRYFYYLGHKCLDIVTKSTLSSIFSTSPLPPKPPKPRNMTPTMIDWKEDSKDDHCALESSFLQAASKQSDVGNEVISRKNNSVSEIVPENTGTQEDNHLIEANEGKVYLEERNSETIQSTEKNSRKRSLHERAKVNDLGGISIPSTPEFSAVGSLREWLNGGGHLYSPGVSITPSFGSYFHGNQRSTSNVTVNPVQFRIDEAEIEIHSPSALELDKQASINVDSGVYSDGRLPAIEKEYWDSPLFDPELLASFERDLEQLSEEEKCLLRQIDDGSYFRDCHLEDGEDDLHDSRRVEDIPYPE
ncbi:hypothetical protein KI387_029518, partial [Taxus chinensis]